MRFKVNNKYIVDAKSHDDAIRVVKMLDADEYMIEGNIVDKDDPMMTYQAYRNIARKYHLTIKNYTGNMLDLYGSKNDLQRYERDMHMSFSAIEKAHDSVKDAGQDSDVDLDFLIKDEIEAIDGYRKMIAKTSNSQLLSVLSHILDEETEHVEELRAAQAGVYEVDVNDSIHDRLGEGKCAPAGRTNLVSFAKTVVELFEDVQRTASAPRYEERLRSAKYEYDQIKDMIKRERQEIDAFDKYWQSHKNEMMANILEAEKVLR